MNDWQVIENYENLAIAIIKQACDDFKRGNISEVSFKRFIYSDMFSNITRFDPDTLYELMKKERKEYEQKKKKRNNR